MADGQAEALATIDAAIRIIPDFPQPGILFRDITPLLADPAAFALAQALLLERAQAFAPDAIVAVEARGFLFGAPLALDLGVPLVPVRKPGKLPGDTHSVDYGLEYGTDRLEIHSDALVRGARVLLVDDLLATGGTVRAAADLVERLGADVVGALFLIELVGLGGAERLTEARIPVSALLRV
jgi:adenine phosphoribosyltransferase